MARVNREQVAGGIMLAVGLMLATIFAANLLPPAFDDWFNASTSDWGGITAALWPFVPPVVILAVIFYFLNMAFDIV